MMKILFVCHGNICRSPMAEYILKALLRARGLEDRYYVESAAVSTEEIGNPIYPPARRCLNQHGIPFDVRCPIPGGAATSQIPGIQAILRRPSRIS